jgi:PAS domain S-box-containing protein
MSIRRIFSSLSIRGKLFFVLSSWIVLISLFILGYFPSRLKSRSLDAYVDKVKSITEMVSYAVAPAMFFDDMTGIDEVLRTAQQNTDLVSIRLRNLEGKVIRSFERPLLPALAMPTAPGLWIMEREGLIHTLRPVVQGEKEIGWIDLRFSIKEIQKGIRRSQQTIALISLIFLSGGFLFAFAISTLITKPLRHLSDTVDSIIRGDLTSRSQIDSGDEVGQLSKSFNVMLDRLDRALGELENLNEGLEQRVEERTIDLQREISDRLGVEEELRQTNQKVQAIIDSSPLALFTLDRDARVTSWSPAAERIFGWSESEAVGRFNPIVPEEKKGEFESLNSQVLAGTGYSGNEVVRWTKDGRAIDVSVSTAPLFDAQGTVVGALEILEDISERKRTEKAMLETLKEKEVLLREIHHRVKNNMQIISSLLRLQSSQTENQAVRDIFRASQNRIRSMALVHEKLYVSKDLSRINFSDYIQSLAIHIFQSYQIDSGLIHLKTDLEDVFLDIQTAVPCALILNELITNALKYAFPNGRPGEIEIRLQTLTKPKHCLVIKDTGVGIPSDVDLKNPKSLGLEIVAMLVGQLDGSIEIRREGGSEFIIIFNESHYAPRI